jgi:hypothetical protein
MKRLFFLATLLASFSLSCNKSHNSGSAYYIKANIDGAAKNFSGGVFATRTSDNTGYSVNINGLFSSSSGEGMDVLVSSNNPSQIVGAGTYNDSSSVYTILLVYAPSATGAGYTGGTPVTDSARAHGISIANHLQVVITSITSSEVQGTFSGDIFLNGDATADKKTVMNGSFYAKFQ